MEEKIIYRDFAELYAFLRGRVVELEPKEYEEPKEEPKKKPRKKKEKE